MTETDLLRAVHLAVGSRPDVRLFRINVGVGVPVSRACPDCRARGVVRYGVPGMADLIGILAPTGRLLSIECKSNTGRMTAEQRAWDAMVRRFGGLSVAPARSVDEVMDALSR